MQIVKVLTRRTREQGIQLHPCLPELQPVCLPSRYPAPHAKHGTYLRVCGNIACGVKFHVAGGTDRVIWAWDGKQSPPAFIGSHDCLIDFLCGGMSKSHQQKHLRESVILAGQILFTPLTHHLQQLREQLGLRIALIIEILPHHQSRQIKIHFVQAFVLQAIQLMETRFTDDGLHFGFGRQVCCGDCHL